MSEQLIVAVWRAPTAHDRDRPWHWDLAPASRRLHSNGIRRSVLAMGIGKFRKDSGSEATHEAAVLAGLAALADREPPRFRVQRHATADRFIVVDHATGDCVWVTPTNDRTSADERAEFLNAPYVD